MQINRVQSIYSYGALNQINNQTKVNSNIQSTNLEQATNTLHCYIKPLSFGISKIGPKMTAGNALDLAGALLDSVMPIITHSKDALIRAQKFSSDFSPRYEVRLNALSDIIKHVNVTQGPIEKLVSLTDNLLLDRSRIEPVVHEIKIEEILDLVDKFDPDSQKIFYTTKSQNGPTILQRISAMKESIKGNIKERIIQSAAKLPNSMEEIFKAQGLQVD